MDLVARIARASGLYESPVLLIERNQKGRGIGLLGTRLLSQKVGLVRALPFDRVKFGGWGGNCTHVRKLMRLAIGYLIVPSYKNGSGDGNRTHTGHLTRVVPSHRGRPQSACCGFQYHLT